MMISIVSYGLIMELVVSRAFNIKSRGINAIRICVFGLLSKVQQFCSLFDSEQVIINVR